MCGNLHLHCMCRFRRHVHTRKKVKKKYLNTMHPLYVVDSERGGVLRNDKFLFLNKYRFLQMTP